MLNKLTLTSIVSLAAIAAAAALYFALPTPAAAQDTGPVSQIYCPKLSQTLFFGMRDSQTNPRGQVSELQKFLSDFYDLDPDQYVTGYFGRLTRDNVRKFQCEKGIICSGDEEDGYGVVGPRTRTAITAACGGGTYAQATYYSQATYNSYSQATYYSQASYVPSATFNANPIWGSVPFAVTFSGRGAEYGDVIEFGDRNSRTIINIAVPGCVPGSTCDARSFYSETHTYTVAGTYTARLVRRGGEVLGTAVVTVVGGGTTSTSTSPVPTISLTVNGQSAATIAPFASYTVQYSSSNATACTMVSPAGSSTPITANTSGTVQGTVGAAGTAQTHLFSCSNESGAVVQQVTVTAQGTAIGGHTLDVVHAPNGDGSGQRPLGGNFGPRAYMFTVNIDGSLYTGGCLVSDLTGCGAPGSPFTALKYWGATPFKILAGDGTEYTVFGSCNNLDYTQLSGPNPPNPCKIIHAYGGRGVYTVRLVDTRLACGQGATSCPGYVVKTTNVTVE